MPHGDMSRLPPSLFLVVFVTGRLYTGLDTKHLEERGRGSVAFLQCDMGSFLSFGIGGRLYIKVARGHKGDFYIKVGQGHKDALDIVQKLAKSKNGH